MYVFEIIFLQYFTVNKMFIH